MGSSKSGKSPHHIIAMDDALHLQNQDKQSPLA